MHLTPAERDRLTVFTVAELARRRLARGRLLSAPETTALITDAILEAAWDGLPLEEIQRAGGGAVAPEQTQPGVASLVRRVEVDALTPSGTVLVAVDEPLGPPLPEGPGAVETAPGSVELSPGRTRRDLDVHNVADREVRVSSHYPFHDVNAALSFDRAAARGTHLDIPAGSSLVFPPGRTVRARLVHFADGDVRASGDGLVTEHPRGRAAGRDGSEAGG